jgi:hypothetical protein
MKPFSRRHPRKGMDMSLCAFCGLPIGDPRASVKRTMTAKMLGRALATKTAPANVGVQV